jgi:hypothetical protein
MPCQENTHKSDAEKDSEKLNFDALQRANIQRVFNERNPVRRVAAIEDLYAPEPILYEPVGIVRGREGVAKAAGDLLERFGPQFALVPDGSALGHDGLGVLRWHATGGPPGLAGLDIAEVVDGRIHRLWVMLQT